MSKFGFGRKAAIIDSIMLGAMQRVANETRDYFVKNFDTESFNNKKWPDLQPSTRNSKTENLPILNVTGELKRQTNDSIKSVTKNRVLMENTAMDSRGRQYSNYHNEGTGQRGDGYAWNPKRSIMKQTDELTDLQLQILFEETGKIWRKV